MPELGLTNRFTISEDHAERSGVEVGDRVIEVDGRPIRDPSELATDIGGRAAGDAVALTVARAEQRVELNVVLDGASR